MSRRRKPTEDCCQRDENLGESPAHEAPKVMTYCKACGRTWRTPGPLASGPGAAKAR